jgi:hypothetical protein
MNYGYNPMPVNQEPYIWEILNNKHHHNHHCREYCGPQPPNCASGNNLFFTILIFAFIFLIKRRPPLPC